MKQIAFAAVLFTAGYFPLAAQQPGKLKRTEVVVIADLSNRIDARLHPGQVTRDTAIIRMIAQEFHGLVRQNRFLFSRDRIRVVYTGESTPPIEPRVDVGQMNLDRVVVVKVLPAVLDSFVTEATRPYSGSKSFVGADIWGWFKNTAPIFLGQADTSRINRVRVILLTDGYLEFASRIQRAPGTSMRMDMLRRRSDWRRVYPSVRLASVGHSFTNGKVLVLELAPLNPNINVTEEEILKRYWTDWFGDMGMEARFVSNSVGLPTVRDIIRQFLLN